MGLNMTHPDEEEWRSALASQPESNGVGDVRIAGGFMIVGDPSDAWD